MSFKQDPQLTMRQFKQKIQAIEQLTINVGIPKEVKAEKTEEEMYVADIAFENNFGVFSKNIPARPFGSTVEKKYESKIKEVINNEMNLYFIGKKSLKKAYNRIGLFVKGYMQHNLRFGGWKANRPVTIALKGSAQPLIDTGQMRQSITYVVAEKEK